MRRAHIDVSVYCKMKITCSILCYNYGRFLSNAIESCLAQTVDRSLFEILVIDDGSTDNTPEVCARYADRIRISRTPNQGFSRSLARGLEEARGDYVAYMDADDWWAPQKLATLLPVLERGALVTMHPLVEVDEQGRPLGRVGACGNTSSVCVHRAAGLTLLPATTEIFCRPLLDAGRGVELAEPLGYYRIHGKAMTDRSATSAHTAFFAKTSHVTADRLYELSIDPPFWAASQSRLRRLAHAYRAEGWTKDFERSTELGKFSEYPKHSVRTVLGWLRAGRLPSRRACRLLARAVAQVLGLKRPAIGNASPGR